MTILEEIAEYTKARIEKEKKQISTNELRTLAEKMNENEGFVFEDATWWIKQTIIRAISNHSRTIRIPVHMLEKIRN